MGEVLSPAQFQQRYGQSSGQGGQPGTMAYYDNFARPESPADDTYGYGPTDPPPSGLAPTTKTSIGADLIFNNGKGLGAILNRDPSVVYRNAFATHQADNATKIANLRNALQSYNGLIDDFENIGKEAGPDVLPLAIGPDYSDRENPKPADNSWLPSVSGTINALTKMGAAARAPAGKGLGIMNGDDTGSTAYVANMAARLGSGDRNKPNKYDKALDVNTRLTHLNDAIAMVYKTLPMGAQGGGTDQAQGIVKEMVKKAINAPDSETFFRVINDARRAISALGRYGKAPPSSDGSQIPLGFDPTKEAQLAKQAGQRASFLPPDMAPQQTAPQKTASAMPAIDDLATAAKVPAGQTFTFKGHNLRALGNGQFETLN